MSGISVWSVVSVLLSSSAHHFSVLRSEAVTGGDGDGGGGIFKIVEPHTGTILPGETGPASAP